MKQISCLLLSMLTAGIPFAQKQNLIYIDREGVVRFTNNKKEAAFFGVNYTVPFAYGYRSHKALGADIEKAIEADVYHMSRLGLDAFRVHVWDVEITDSLGNLLQNEHLRLFDFLIAQLKKRNIRILVTPVAFWGNGYPERDEKTPGFSTVYGKGNAVVKEQAIRAQENYMKQFFTHVNPYTKLSYTDDPAIIATEINNEPHHSGPKEKTTEYINRLYAAIRSTGWTKPIFYNISESPGYADAVVKSNAQGYSFQWYPTGLVANREQKGNFLPHVDHYRIPFGDTLTEFKNKPLMVYEFDAADLLQSNMYPAIARSYRTAGFWWATQFAYDPMMTAYGNSEYQTHYLNLLYTPSKAISLLIASKAFHRLQRHKNYGSYPADTLFDVFRVSYINDLSEMNSDEEFYHTNHTTTKPKDLTRLKHIAGVGSSPVIEYGGTGAYFLDRIADGAWRLEVLPDAVVISDPFARASPKKTVVRLVSAANKMVINVPELTSGFTISRLTRPEVYTAESADNEVAVTPGVYLVTKLRTPINVSTDYFQPPIERQGPVLQHSEIMEASAGNPFPVTATIAGIDSTYKVLLEVRPPGPRWRTVPMNSVAAYLYRAEVPAEIVTPGVLNYRIIVQKGTEEYHVFPGASRENPYAWDNYQNDTWQTFVANEQTTLELFNPNRDRLNLMLYNPDWRNNTIEYISGERSGQLVMKMSLKSSTSKMLGWQFYFADRVKGRSTEFSKFKTIVVRARSAGPAELKVKLISKDAQGFSSAIRLSNEYREIEIPLGSLKKDSILLLPRPYPGFLPLWFRLGAVKPFNLADAEKLEMSFMSEKPVVVEVETIYIKK